MNTANTTVNQHLGAKAIFDHIFVDISDIDSNKGLYIWSDAPLYNDLLSISQQLGAETRPNLQEVHPVIMKVYENRTGEPRVIKDLDTMHELPEKWFK